MGCVYLQPQEGNGGISLSKYFPVPPASDSIESHAIQLLHSWGKLELSSPFSPPEDTADTGFCVPIALECHVPFTRALLWVQGAQTMYLLPL